MTDQNAPRPAVKPACADFSSGPCAKRPGWSASALRTDILGRSHRAKVGKTALKDAIDRSKALLELPEDWVVAIVPASDTGAFEMAMWSMLGARGVDALAWESFGAGWVTDATKQLKLEDCRVIKSDYGFLPPLSDVEFDRDVMFTWNGTTSGVRVPNADWIPANREGLVFCDATSAVFAQQLQWDKLDVVTWSWQKALGSEGGHGMLMLSPRAVARLESYAPARPLPKIFRMTKGGKLNASIFEGATINTPSMLAVADFLDALTWVESLGGVEATIARADANANAIHNWVEKTSWIANLAVEPIKRTNTSVCLSIIDPKVTALDEAEQTKFAKKITSMLEAEDVAYDIGSYRDAPSGLRIWCGPTVETSDIEALLPWLDWAFAQASDSLS